VEKLLLTATVRFTKETNKKNKFKQLFHANGKKENIVYSLYLLIIVLNIIKLHPVYESSLIKYDINNLHS
jgi:hypothetical protein